MIFVSRGTKTIDITPTGWAESHTNEPAFFARASSLFALLGAQTMDPAMREFVGLFSDVQVSVARVIATMLVPTDLTDEEIESRRVAWLKLAELAWKPYRWGTYDVKATSLPSSEA